MGGLEVGGRDWITWRNRLDFPIPESPDKPSIPNFEILGRIGGGAYGEVFLARSVTGMYRAVKVVRREDFEYERTFEREFEGIQRYEQVSQDHPGLVDVLHVGRDSDAGFYYYVMELADDENGHGEEVDPETYKAKTLTSELRRNSSRDVSNCVNIGMSLAGALGHLHLAGLTHRDVKPSNIIFVKGVPKLADVGLVAATGQRTFVGTEGYVPPEGPGTSSADLYSLAMVLYEMHTGKDRMDFPELPTNLEIPPTVNRDEWRALNAVICRAGSPDSGKRYDSAHTLALALREVIASNIPGSGKKSRGGVKVFVTLLLLAFFAAAGYGGYWVWKDTQSFVDENSNLFVSNGEGKEEIPANEVEVKTDPVSSEADDDASSLEPDMNAEVTDPSVVSGEGEEDVVITDQAENGEEMSEDRPEVNDEATEAPGDEPKEEDKPLLVASIVTGQLKIMSEPNGATVWIDGEEVARTETSPLEFPVGPVELVLKHPRYRDTRQVVEVSEEFQLIEVPLIPDYGPIAGASWSNSVGVSFEPLADGGHVMSQLVSTQLFDSFTELANLQIPRTGKEGVAITLERDAMWKFCDWMTAQDRVSGYLGQNQYYRPVDILPEGGGEMFRCRTENRFGSLVINSEPTGATVTVNGQRYSDPTPVTITDVRLGPFEVLYELPGHANKINGGEITKAEVILVEETLTRDSSVIFGEPWTNSVGMPLVPIGSIMVAQFETRVSDFREFVTNSGIVPMPSSGFPQTLTHPVTSVTPAEAAAFCNWLTLREQQAGLIQSTLHYRLPTDLEWSLMAGENPASGSTPEERGRNGGNGFLWGSEWPPPAGNYADLAAKSTFGQYVIADYSDGFATTSPVGSFVPGPNGLADLGGNVWEWVSDSYNKGRPELGVLRGGGWDSHDRNVLRTSYRNPVPTDSRGGSYGFRFVLAPISE